MILIKYPLSFDEPPGIYIHVPFCRKKCYYCDFYSEVYEKEELEKKIVSYIKSLKKEISFYFSRINTDIIKTIYFGGGTPGILSGENIREILEHLLKNLKISSTGEISIETNPLMVDKERIMEYKKAGINRLSLGIQSLNNRRLKTLGRLHSREKALTAINIVKNNLTNFNLDLIFAVPGQSLSEWKNTLNKILDFNPPHLSLYNLQIEEGTYLYEQVEKEEIRPIAEELDARMFKIALKRLKEQDYRHYEISNFALPGYQSRHNLLYWKFKPYLGLGPAAHSFDGENRFYNYSNIKKYYNVLAKGQLPIQQFLSLSSEDLMAEKMMMGLRLIDGVDKNEFYKRFGISLKKVYFREIKTLKKKKLIKENPEKIQLTRKGLMFGNQVFQEFLP
ncbi:MAG: radical SAM family heme chaperone HemW [Bacillota bacterium]